MHRYIDVYNLEQQIDRQFDREEEEKVDTDRFVQIERQLDREGVGTDRCIQHRTIDRERGGGGRHRQMYTTENNRQIEKQ